MKQYENISMDVLMERAKELECLYLIEEALEGSVLSDIFIKVCDIAPLGFRNPEACRVIICFNDELYATKPALEKYDMLQADIVVDGKNRGYIRILYPHNIFAEDDSAFLPQEIKLTHTIAARISESIYKQELRKVGTSRRDWEAILTLLQKTDQEMLLYICEKMFALLARTSPQLFTTIFSEMDWLKYKNQGEINFPLETLPAVDTVCFCQDLFASASTCFSDSQIYEYINLWIYQGKTYELIKVVDKKHSDAKDIAKALDQYIKAIKDNEMPSETTKRWLRVELMRRFLVDNPKLIANVQEYVSIEAFCKLLSNFICSPKSIGRIGGKASGLFIARQIIESTIEHNEELINIKIPKTWYISSYELKNLIEDNNLDELNEHKYRDILDIRTSYPRIIQMIKNAKMSPYILNDLSQILESCPDKPLIVRSSSLLEDQVDSSFSGKYKSLFLTNTGTKAQRLKRLVEGLLEVYASLFNPDSIQYRKERNLLDCSEQMGVMIQEVVGTQVGTYFFPLYAGVAFSHNEFLWSPRLKREDGLIRMVMGLGTRAVDRVGEDFPVLISPGQPNLRPNQIPQEIKRYSPQMIDVLDLENNQFLTLPISKLIKSFGNEIPYIQDIASVLKGDIISDVNRLVTDFQTEDIIITFDSLIRKTPIIKQIKTLLSLLKEKLGYPVDIEFASDGKNLYLLQCRAQSRNQDNTPAAIPVNISFQDTIFTANRYISNGKVTGIKTVVYVDPVEYSRLEKYEDLVNVGRAISELNRILPRRSFILMGPGRWGSRGDIKLGVPIAYSDINNTSMLIEIAQKESKYQPELSFGTHFFQDLVEENIKYLPLYPEDKQIIFNQSFFSGSKNALNHILPAFSHLSEVVRVIQLEKSYFGQELVVLMNSDLDKAIAYLEHPENLEQQTSSNPNLPEIKDKLKEKKDAGWRWRHYMAEQIAKQMDIKELAVKGVYLFGSTNSGTARLNSDIDLIIHFNGNEYQRHKLETWLNGWSKALAEMNYLRTGYKADGLLDVHFITDQDILNKNSYAVKINSIYDPAYPLRLALE